jgi:hypothetical protein
MIPAGGVQLKIEILRFPGTYLHSSRPARIRAETCRYSRSRGPRQTPTDPRISTYSSVLQQTRADLANPAPQTFVMKTYISFAPLTTPLYEKIIVSTQAQNWHATKSKLWLPITSNKFHFIFKK